MSQKKRYENPEQLELNSRLRRNFYQTEAGKYRIECYKKEMSIYWNNDEWRKKQQEKKGTRIVQLNLDMTIEKIWSSMRQIENESNGYYRDRLRECVSNTYGLYGNGYHNFIWLKESDYNSFSLEQINDYINKYKNYDFDKAKIERSRISNLKNKVVQLDLNMNIIKLWNGVAEPQRTTNYKKSQITRCCKHEAKTNIYKGYIWMYEEEYLKLNNISNTYQEEQSI